MEKVTPYIDFYPDERGDGIEHQFGIRKDDFDKFLTKRFKRYDASEIHDKLTYLVKKDLIKPFEHTDEFLIMTQEGCEVVDTKNAERKKFMWTWIVQGITITIAITGLLFSIFS